MPQINSSMVWTVLTAISTSAVLLAFVAWLVRSVITHWLSKDIEQFKMTMKYEKDIEIERLKGQLKKMTAEHEIMFNQLHTKVFATIARLYKLIVVTQMAMGEYFAILRYSDSPSEEERGKVAIDAWNSLNSFFRAHEIYFDKNTCKVVNEYLKGLHDLVIDFQTRKDEKNYAKKWSEVWNKLNGEMENLKRSLEDSFRSKIGVES